MEKIKWYWSFGVYVPFCPYCGEPAYEKEQCTFCGKEYEWVEGKYKPTVVEEGEYTIIQSTNKNVSVYKNGELIRHINYTKKCTETELRNFVKEAAK